jgi:hypothetical protein
LERRPGLKCTRFLLVSQPPLKVATSAVCKKRRPGARTGLATTTPVVNAGGGGLVQERKPGARAGLEPTPLLINAGNGCSEVVKPREAAIASS